MNCPINPEIDLKPFRIKIAGDLKNILNTPDEQINLDQYIKDTYIMVRDSVADTDLALDYAMLIPQIVQQMTAVDAAFAKALRKRGLTMDALLDNVSDMAEISTKEQLTELKQKLGTSDADASGGPPVNVLGNISKGKNKKKGDPNQTDLFSGPVTDEQVNNANKENPPTQTTKPPLVQSIVRKFKNIINIITNRIFHAPTALSSMVITNDPMEKVFLENVQRNIIEQLAEKADGDYVTSEVILEDKDGDPFPPIVLSMISAKELISNERYKDVLTDEAKKNVELYDNEGVYMVFTDKNGNVAHFLEDGSPTLGEFGSPRFLV